MLEKADFGVQVDGVLGELVSAYEDVLTASNSTGGAELPVAIRALGHAIGVFRQSLAKIALNESLSESISSRKRLAWYVSSGINRLYAVQSSVVDVVPIDDLRSGLGRNFVLHCSITNLTPEVLINFFDISAMLHDNMGTNGAY